MVEAFTDQFSGGKKNAGRIRLHRFEFRNQRGAPLLRHPAVQHEGVASQLATGLGKGQGILFPFGLVEIDSEEMAGVVGQQWVDTDGALPARCS